MTKKIIVDNWTREKQEVDLESFIRFQLSDQQGDYIDAYFDENDRGIKLMAGWRGALSISPEVSNVIRVKIEER